MSIQIFLPPLLVHPDQPSVAFVHPKQSTRKPQSRIRSAKVVKSRRNSCNLLLEVRSQIKIIFKAVLISLLAKTIFICHPGTFFEPIRII